MAMKRCGRCGKSIPKGDKVAEIAHAVSCKRNVLHAGPYLGKRRQKK